MMRRLRILTWHIHGSYLYYLSQCRHDFFLPVTPDRASGYIGRQGQFPFGDNVQDVPADEVRLMEFDCILFQHTQQYLHDQYTLLTEEQRKLPRIYLEHDTPRGHLTDTRHPVDDPSMLLVHVTHFNRVMWDNGRTPTMVIDHGIVPPAVSYTGELEHGVVVVNHLVGRGRLAGWDLFQQVRARVPLVLAGMDAERAGGREVPHAELPAFMARHRFFFHPMRYTSMGLAVCEAMHLGMPIVGLATTELPTVIRDGESGFIHTDVDALVRGMERLRQDRELAAALGRQAKAVAQVRFGIDRFVQDWERAFAVVTAGAPSLVAAEAAS